VPRWTRSPTGTIYTPSPVARDHPLATGLVSWWLALPHNSGGRLLYDLVGRYNLSVSNTIKSVGATYNPGVPLAMLTTGAANSFASVADGGVFNFSDQTFTAAFWHLPLNATNEGRSQFGKGTGSFETKGWMFGKGIMQVYNGTGAVTTGSWTYTVGQWQHVAAVITTSTTVSSNNTFTIYINGKNANVTPSAQSGTYTGSTNTFTIGAVGGGGTTCAFNDARLWNRGLSAGEIAAVYQDSLEGYPGTIRRTRSSTVFVISATVASLSLTLESTTVTGTATSTAPTPTTGGLSLTLASLTTTATASATVPTPTTASLSVTLASISTTARATSAGPAPTTGTLAVTLGGVTLAGVGTLTYPDDLFDAIVAWCNADPTLTGYFGRQGWLWIAEAPDGEAFPYAVLSQSDSDLSFESFSSDGTEPAIESATYQISIFSQDRQLNRTISAEIGTWLDAAPLTHNDGYLMGLRVESQTDMLDPDRGPQGKDVWQRAMMIDVREGHNQTVIAATYTPTPAATDLADALVAMLASDSTLAGAGYFARADWLWMQEAPDGQTIPYGVLVQKESKRHIESASSDATRPVVEDASYELHIFAGSRATCRTLGELIGAMIDGANLTFGDGYPMYLRRQSDTDTLDDDRSRLGADVWRRVISITAITGHTE
jgi:Concanavalin A-like lectin/glucanases superfamily/Protein of unknown function (DUF3168)